MVIFMSSNEKFQIREYLRLKLMLHMM
jgi:hypothetical protein